MAAVLVCAGEDGETEPFPMHKGGLCGKGGALIIPIQTLSDTNVNRLKLLVLSGGHKVMMGGLDNLSTGKFGKGLLGLITKVRMGGVGEVGSHEEVDDDEGGQADHNSCVVRNGLVGTAATDEERVKVCKEENGEIACAQWGLRQREGGQREQGERGLGGRGRPWCVTSGVHRRTD